MNKDLVFGVIRDVERHPNADRLWIVQVDIGHILQIVHGGTRELHPGDIVIVAPPGSRVMGKKMRSRTYRGAFSQGMLCSWEEIGTGPGPDEVAVL